MPFGCNWPIMIEGDIVRIMGCYVEAIKGLERDRNALYHAVESAFLVRDQSPLKRRDWELAAKRFGCRQSSIDALIETCYRGGQDTITLEQREFMFDYIAVDPQFFRSGYIMERILRRVKRLPLSEYEKRILRKMLMGRVKVKAFRNFRDVCRLIPIFQDSELRTEIEELTHSLDAGIRHRAMFARAFFTQ